MRHRSSWCDVGPNVKLIDFKRLAPDKGITYSRDHLRRKVKAKEFPAPISVSDHRIGWDEAEIDEWLAAKKRARNNGPPPVRSIKTERRATSMSELPLERLEQPPNEVSDDTLPAAVPSNKAYRRRRGRAAGPDPPHAR
jgi:predicted DNA-binding transcriptional regulator AlpA